MPYNEKLYCPVCKIFLGERDKDDLFSEHCNECRSTFTWMPRKKKPKALLDRKKPQECNCGRHS